MTNHDKIETAVKKILTEKLDVQDGQLVDQARFHEDLGIDSLDKIEVLMEIEKEFNLKVPDEDAEKLTTVGSLVQYVNGNTH